MDSNSSSEKADCDGAEKLGHVENNEKELCDNLTERHGNESKKDDEEPSQVTDVDKSSCTQLDPVDAVGNTQRKSEEVNEENEENEAISDKTEMPIEKIDAGNNNSAAEVSEERLVSIGDGISDPELTDDFIQLHVQSCLQDSLDKVVIGDVNVHDESCLRSESDNHNNNKRKRDVGDDQSNLKKKNCNNTTKSGDSNAHCNSFTKDSDRLIGSKRIDAEVPSSLMPIVSRDEMAKSEEDTGKVEFRVIKNDGSEKCNIQLMTLKNIFALQLPKMPREYIVRLVFDRAHRSLVILKKTTTSEVVVGGICYRPYYSQHFAEIAFCAITASEQVKGYGTRLMNHLKEYVKKKNINYFLTYADNYAIGYFKKQGFSKTVSMPKEQWFGYIKDYDGGTLMECAINNQVNYLKITLMIRNQRQCLMSKINERSKFDVVYPGLKFNNNSGKISDLFSIPGIMEGGWTSSAIRSSRRSRGVNNSANIEEGTSPSTLYNNSGSSTSLNNHLVQLWKSIYNHRSAWPFHDPVDTATVTDYLDYVKEPIDLTLIERKINQNKYTSKSQFKRDIDLMLKNCTTYNAPDTNYYKAALDVQAFVDSRIIED